MKGNMLVIKYTVNKNLDNNNSNDDDEFLAIFSCFLYGGHCFDTPVSSTSAANIKFHLPSITDAVIEFLSDFLEFPALYMQNLTLLH